MPLDHLSGSTVLTDAVRQFDLEDFVVLAPDVGGLKMARSYAQRLGVDLALIDKRRPSQNEARVMNVIGEVEGKNVIIIDDIVDTAGTLTGVGQAAGFLDDDGNLPEIEKPLMADGIGTTAGGILGTSTVTTYIESATGVEEGGRTGMTALVIAVLFLARLALVPLAAAIPLDASHIALVVIAVVMLGNIVEVDWDDITHAIPAGMTILIMPFTFNIGYGIAAGIISYPVVKLAAGKAGDLRPGHYVLAGAFVVYFFVRTSGLLSGQLSF